MGKYSVGMSSRLGRKGMRARMVPIAFFLLFGFWLVGLHYGLDGGVATYLLLLIGIVVFLKAFRGRSTST